MNRLLIDGREELIATISTSVVIGLSRGAVLDIAGGYWESWLEEVL